MGKRRITAIVVACVCLLVGACGVQKTEPGSVNLSQVVMAVGLNPPAQKFTTNEHGMVALVRKDGTAQFIDTATIEPQNMAWNESGLFFDDKRSDFYISNTPGHGYVSEREQPNVPGWQMVAIDDHTVMAMYQSAYSEAERSGTMQTQWFTPQPQQLVTSLAEMPVAVAHCASGVYAVGSAGSDYTLYSVSESAGMKKLSTNSVDSRFAPALASGLVPYVGDEIVLLGGVDDEAKGTGYGSQTLTLLKWNVSTQKLTQNTVITASGEAQKYVGEESFVYGEQLTRQSGDAHEMIAMSTGGNVEIIDMRTGRIADSAEPPQTFDVGKGQYDIVGAGEFAYMVFMPTGGSKDDARIYVYRKSDWKLVHTITAQGALNDLLGNRKELYPTVFAANPNMRWN